jgi:hypothetical protein
MRTVVTAAIVAGVATIAPTAAAALPATIAQANANHKVQFYHPVYNWNGPSRSSNCGPTSLAIVLKTLGAEPPNISPERSIDHARYLMYPGDTRRGWDPDAGVRILDLDSALSSTAGAQTAYAMLGGWAETGTGSANLSARLGEGKPAVLSGKTTASWRNQFPVRGDYGGFTEGFGHIIAVVGKQADGRFLVSDPMYRSGAVAMSAGQLAVFNGGGITYTAAVGIGGGEPALFKDTSTLRSGGEWDHGRGKATCAVGETVGGLSEEVGGYGRQAYCRRGGATEFRGNVVRTLTVDHGRDERAAQRAVGGNPDWAPGYWKLECGASEYVSAISENAGGCQGNNWFHNLQCSSGGPGLGSPNKCDVRVFDAGDGRATTASGDWDYGAFKGECGLSQYAAGVSVDPGSRRPHSILCCNR